MLYTHTHTHILVRFSSLCCYCCFLFGLPLFPPVAAGTHTELMQFTTASDSRLVNHGNYAVSLSQRRTENAKK